MGPDASHGVRNAETNLMHLMVGRSTKNEPRSPRVAYFFFTLSSVDRNAILSSAAHYTSCLCAIKNNDGEFHRCRSGSGLACLLAVSRYLTHRGGHICRLGWRCCEQSQNAISQPPIKPVAEKRHIGWEALGVDHRGKALDGRLVALATPLVG